MNGARAHNLHVVLLWFGTWKNGKMHYAPPLSRNTLDGDKAAFTTLMRQLKSIDGDDHTVLLIQLENESANIGNVRDFSAEANRQFAGPVPCQLLRFR